MRLFLSVTLLVALTAILHGCQGVRPDYRSDSPAGECSVIVGTRLRGYPIKNRVVVLVRRSDSSVEELYEGPREGLVSFAIAAWDPHRKLVGIVVHDAHHGRTELAYDWGRSRRERFAAVRVLVAEEIRRTYWIRTPSGTLKPPLPEFVSRRHPPSENPDPIYWASSDAASEAFHAQYVADSARDRAIN